MNIEKAKSILRWKAIKRHPDKLLSYCGSAICWDDCFTVFNGELIFWYNVGKNTHAEKLILAE